MLLHPLGIVERPSPAELRERFDEARTWVSSLTRMRQTELEWQHVNNRRVGRQDLPVATVFRQLKRRQPRLNTVEQHLYDDLRDNRIHAGLRLDQEHIRYSHLADLLTDC